MFGTGSGGEIFCKYIIQICYPSERRKICGYPRALPRGRIPRRIRTLLSPFQFLLPLAVRNLLFPTVTSVNSLTYLSTAFLAFNPGVFAPILFHFPLVRAILVHVAGDKFPIGSIVRARNIICWRMAEVVSVIQPGRKLFLTSRPYISFLAVGLIEISSECLMRRLKRCIHRKAGLYGSQQNCTL